MKSAELLGKAPRTIQARWAGPSRYARVAMILLVSVAAATTWVVNKEGTGDFGQVQSAIDVARAGDIIEVGPGTYRGALLVRSRILTLRSRDGSGTTILDGAGEAQLLRLESAEVVLEGFTLVNEGGAGVVTVDRSEVEARDLVFTSLLGAFSMENGAASFEDCQFVGGEAEMGAGIRADAGTVTVLDSVFDGNNANYGADVYLGPGGRLSLEGVSSSGAVASEDGGSVYLSMLADAVVTECSFDRGTAGNGGAIALVDASVTLDRVSFSLGTASRGGAVFGDGGTIASLGATFDGNTAQEGGAVALVDGELDDAGSVFAGNVAADEGGAILAIGSRLGVSGASFEGNVASVAPAIRARDGEGVSMANVSLFANEGGLPVWGDAWPWTVDGLTSGGHTNEPVALFTGTGEVANVTTTDGALVFDGDFLVHDVVISGGEFGIFLDEASLALVRARLSATTALGTGGGVLRTSAVTVSRGDVVASGGTIQLEHTTVIDGAIRGEGGLVEGHSVIAAGPIEGDVTLAYSDLVASTLGGEGNMSADPQFIDAEADPADLRLWRTSPCIDAGDPSATDPDGTRADMGAWSGPDILVSDADHDGHDNASDCDDADGSVFPGAIEFPGDGVDQDCDGADLAALAGDSGEPREETTPAEEGCGCEGAAWAPLLLVGAMRRGGGAGGRRSPRRGSRCAGPS